MSLLPDIKDILEEVRMNPEKYSIKSKSKTKNKKQKYWQKDYVETERERKERIIKFMTPIYQPIGLGKKR